MEALIIIGLGGILLETLRRASEAQRTKVPIRIRTRKETRPKR